MLESSRPTLFTRRSRPTLPAILSIVLLAIGPAACGGSGSKSSSTTLQSTSTTATAPTTTSPSQVGAAPSVSTGPVHGTLHGENHAPRVNRDWRYSVAVSDASGHPLSGTVDIEFAFGGQVVGRDTPPTHTVTNGRWHDTLKFPATAVDMPLTFRAVVHTRLGSITLDWPVTVRQ